MLIILLILCEYLCHEKLDKAIPDVVVLFHQVSDKALVRKDREVGKSIFAVLFLQVLPRESSGQP